MTKRRKFMAGDRLLKMEEVSDLAMLSKNGIYGLIRKGLFPRPIKIGMRRVVWIETEIIDYINRQMELQDAAEYTAVDQFIKGIQPNNL